MLAADNVTRSSAAPPGAAMHIAIAAVVGGLVFLVTLSAAGVHPPTAVSDAMTELAYTEGGGRRTP